MGSSVTPTILVGCPVAARYWILPDWFNAVELACAKAELEPRYAFVVPGDDQPTIDVIHHHTMVRGAEVFYVYTDEDVMDAKRDWYKASRLHDMVALRNQLLGVVRDLRPTYFWSLDSDMIAQPDALANALAVLPAYDAVGMRAFMTTTGLEYTSRAQLVNGQLRGRADTVGTFEVDVVMGAVLMTEPVYDVDYAFHAHGEDIGFCIAARAAGLRLGWTSTASCTHIMSPSFLDWVDPRV
jgi:hypothetical protein